MQQVSFRLSTKIDPSLCVCVCVQRTDLTFHHSLFFYNNFKGNRQQNGIHGLPVQIQPEAVAYLLNRGKKPSLSVSYFSVSKREREK